MKNDIEILLSSIRNGMQRNFDSDFYDGCYHESLEKLEIVLNNMKEENARLMDCISNINYHTTIMAEVINTRTFTPEEFVMSFANLGIAVDDAYISIAPQIEEK